MLNCFAFMAAAQQSKRADRIPDGFWQLNGYPFVIVSTDKVTETPQFSDSLFYAIADGIRFKVGTTSILTSDVHFTDTYTNGLLPIIKKEGMRLRKVFVRGASSPEGSYDLNKRLSNGRTQTIIDMINQSGVASNSNIETTNVTEDYYFLLRLMKAANDPQYESVKSVVDAQYQKSATPEQAEQNCKTALMAMSGGKVWSYLLRTYFPEMRSAKVIFWLEIPTPEIVEEEEPAAPILDEVIVPQEEIVVVPEVVVEEVEEVEEVHVEPVIVPVTPVLPLPVRQHMLAARTNLLYDLFYMPNFGFAPMWDIQLEYYPRKGHMTYNLEFTSPYWKKWDKHKFFQMRDYRIEVRRYFRESANYTGWFASAFVMNDIYGIGISDEKGWKGEGFGGGLQGGYVLPLTPKGDFRLEFYAGVGAYVSKYDPYTYGNPVTGTDNGYYYYKFFGSADKFKERNHKFTWFGPMSAGVALTYDILYRHKVEVVR